MFNVLTFIFIYLIVSPFLFVCVTKICGMPNKAVNYPPPPILEEFIFHCIFHYIITLTCAQFFYGTRYLSEGKHQTCSFCFLISPKLADTVPKVRVTTPSPVTDDEEGVDETPEHTKISSFLHGLKEKFKTTVCSRWLLIMWLVLFFIPLRNIHDGVVLVKYSIFIKKVLCEHFSS